MLREVQTFLSVQQCKGNHLLHFHGNNKHFYIVDRHMYDNNKKGTHCCSSMSTMVTQMCHNVMSYTHSLSCRKESITWVDTEGLYSRSAIRILSPSFHPHTWIICWTQQSCTKCLMPCFVTRNFLNLFFGCIEIFPFFICKCCVSKSKVLAKLALKLRAPENMVVSVGVQQLYTRTCTLQP